MNNQVVHVVIVAGDMVSFETIQFCVANIEVIVNKHVAGYISVKLYLQNQAICNTMHTSWLGKSYSN